MKRTNKYQQPEDGSFTDGVDVPQGLRSYRFISRKVFLKLTAAITVVGVLEGCGVKLINPTLPATPTPEPTLNPSPPVCLTDTEAHLVDEGQALSDAAINPNKLMETMYESTKQTEIQAGRAPADSTFSLFVVRFNYCDQDGKTNTAVYTFVRVDTKDKGSYLMMVAQKVTGNVMEIRSIRLDPSELTLNGQKRFVLALVDDPNSPDPANPIKLNPPQPVFIYDTTRSKWENMTPGERQNVPVQFVAQGAATGLPVNSKDLNVVLRMTPAYPPAVPENTPMPALSPEYSKYFPVEFYQSYDNTIVHGVTIKNMTIGLAKSVTQRALEPVKSFKLYRPDALAIMGDCWLHTCWENYKHYNPGNDGLTYEQYLKQVNSGVGRITVAAVDETASKSYSDRSIVTLDPRDGFFINGTDQQLPVRLNAIKYLYLGKNSHGQLVTGCSIAAIRLVEARQNTNLSPEISLGLQFSTSILDVINQYTGGENTCLMLSAYFEGKCGNFGKPGLDFSKKYLSPVILEMYSNNNPLFIIA